MRMKHIERMVIREIRKPLACIDRFGKLDAYEKANEIKVGNVIEATDFCGDVFKGTVLDFKDGAETEVFVLDENGCVDVWKIADCKKTGKHIEINNILEQIRGD